MLCPGIKKKSSCGNFYEPDITVKAFYRPTHPMLQQPSDEQPRAKVTVWMDITLNGTKLWSLRWFWHLTLTADVWAEQRGLIQRKEGSQRRDLTGWQMRKVKAELMSCVLFIVTELPPENLGMQTWPRVLGNPWKSLLRKYHYTINETTWIKDNPK